MRISESPLVIRSIGCPRKRPSDSIPNRSPTSTNGTAEVRNFSHYSPLDPTKLRFRASTVAPPIYQVREKEKPKVLKTVQRNLCKSCNKSDCICNFEDALSDSSFLSEHEERLPVIHAKKYNDFVYLLTPLYEGRPATLLFDYPPQCLLDSRISLRAFIMSDSQSLSFKISNGACKYNCVVNSFLFAGFNQTSTSSYNVHITNVPKPELLRDMYPRQKINHFPGIWQLGRKDCMWRNYFTQRRKFGKHYDFCPKTFILPEDLPRLQSDREEHPKTLWIMKPAASCCGQGIKVLSANSSISKKQGYIVSKYIDNPHTIRGFKYDLRIYVCVTSFDPLRIYIYEEGLVRFATEMYSTNKKKIKKRYVHLTNFSVNRNSAGFVKNRNPLAENKGSKWSLAALRKYFQDRQIDHSKIFREIESIVIKTLISAEPHVVNALNQGQRCRNLCFEVYGFDILLDSNLKPWLLEVNVSPSLSSSSPLDKRIKTALMCDVFTLIGIVPFDRKAIDKETEINKTSRHLGIMKQPKAAARSLLTLQNSRTLDEYELSEEDVQVLLDYEEEGFRRGKFKRVFPLKSNSEHYSEFFTVLRYNNLLLRKHLQNPSALEKYAKKELPLRLSNQGATCYMNSLLQTLYMTPEFRKEIYRWVYQTEKHGEAADCIPLQLQVLFSKLQLSNTTYVDTTALTKSFQWDIRDSFQQHDVQEFCRVLFDAIEQSVTNTEQSEFIKELYEGTYIDYVKCMACFHESCREDKFLDLSLTVRSAFDNVYNDRVEKALANYIRPEELNGNNQYFCERCNQKQDAMKGLKFKKLPYILVLQLKRFDLDYNTLRRIKLNDLVKFPSILNMNPFMEGGQKSDDEYSSDSPRDEVDIKRFAPPDLKKREISKMITRVKCYLPSDDEKTPLKLDEISKKRQTGLMNEQKQREKALLIERYREDGENVYELYSVMIHSGSANGGHYYAYIKAFDTDKWYNFNDISVKTIDEKDIEKSFGGAQKSLGGWSSLSSSTAYLLMYRKIDENKNLPTVTKDEIPAYVYEERERERQKEIQEELERTEKLKYIKLRVYYEGDEQIVEGKRTGSVEFLKLKAIAAFKLSINPDDARLRVYSHMYESYQEVLNPNRSLESNGLYANRSIAIETKDSGTEWEPFDPNKANVRVCVWDKSIEDSEDKYERMIANPTKVKIDKRDNVKHLMQELEQLFGIPANQQRLMKKTYSLNSEDISRSPSMSMNYLRISENSLLLLERAEGRVSKWQELLSKEASKWTIKFNTIDAEADVYGRIEQKESVQLDSMKTIGELKDRISAQINLPQNEFIIKRGVRYPGEIRDMSLTLRQANLMHGSGIIIERGTPVNPDEMRLIFQLARPPREEDGDGAFFSYEDFGQCNMNVNSTIPQIKQKLVEMHPELEVTKIRIREKTHERVGKTMKDTDTLRQFYHSEKKHFIVEVFENPIEDLPPGHLVAMVRRWHPDTWELSPPTEVIINKKWRLSVFGELLSEVFQIPQERLEVFKVKFVFQFMRSELENERFFKTMGSGIYLSGNPWFLENDGVLFIVRDNADKLRAMTAEEKRKYSIKRNNTWRYEPPKEKSVKIVVKHKNKQKSEETTETDN